MAARKRCLTCGSRQWRKNGVGLVTCSEGHVQPYINESEEPDDGGAHLLKKRTLKSNRKKKERAGRVDPKLYHGDRARFHYYQCLQLLFRKQVAALTALWKLPPEFEMICRDLWTLHLVLTPNPPPAEPFHYARELEESGRPDHSRSGPEDKSGACSSVPAPGGDLSPNDEVLVPEIAVLLEENSEVSSWDDGPCSDGPGTRDEVHTSPKGPIVSRGDRPENTIVVLVLACWTIRLPVVYMDFIYAIEAHSLPYLDHVRSLPPTLVRHLTKHAVQALSPHHAPKTLSLHRLTGHVAGRLYDAFDIAIPGLNAAPVLWRAVQECFCGTPMLYYLTKRVVVSLGLIHEGTPGLWLSSVKRRVGEGDGSTPPEVLLIASALVVLKLVYGLDGKPRLPRSPDDAAWAFPAVGEFLAGAAKLDGGECGHRFGSGATVAVGDLDEAGVDEYLAFCERILTDGDGAHTGPRAIEGYFTARHGGGVDGGARGGCVRGGGERPMRAGGGSAEPGEEYRIYDGEDVLGDVAGELEVVLERAARWAGVGRGMLCGVLERYERRVMRMRDL